VAARDILGLEIVPLGPLNGKSFTTSISPWVVTLDALAPFAIPAAVHNSPIAPYLEDPNQNGTYSLELTAEVLSGGLATQVCMTKLEWAQWSFRHIFAHQAIGGCGLGSGDIIATGTLSGKTPQALGCLLEMTMNGKKPFKLKDGSIRTFLEDGDGIRLTAFAGTPNDGVGFGECVGIINPALTLSRGVQ
jgi:fumarylacetoacetase